MVEVTAFVRAAEAERADLVTADFAVRDLEVGDAEAEEEAGEGDEEEVAEEVDLRFMGGSDANSGTERVTLCLQPPSTDATQ